MKIDYKNYYDKVLACWTGKSLGGIVGAPYECHKQFKKTEIKDLWPKILYPNDDLDIQVVYLEALQEHGVFIDSQILADYWKEHCFYTCCEYGVFIDNYEHKIMPPYSGTWNNDFYHSSMGCPIRSEIWGIICAGNPLLAAEYAAMDGCLDHSQESIQIEQFLSAAASMAFFETDLHTLLQKSLAVIPSDCKAAEICRFTRDVCSNTADVYQAWLKIIRRYGHRNATIAQTNFALTLMALLMGDRDFRKVMQICVQAGWDADCTAATAGALVGLLFGTVVLPQDWCNKMGKTLVCACEIPHQFATLESFASETCLIGVEMSRLRNTEMILEGAPEVKLRKQIKSIIRIQAHYPEKPVLSYYASTVIELHITADKTFQGTIEIIAPEYVHTKYDNTVRITAGETLALPVRISCDRAMEWMKSKNIFHVRLRSSSENAEYEYEFGLQGAREYQIYGPYWDMWDKTRYKVCPYDCEKLTCNPGNIFGLRDAMDMYVLFDMEYLDETMLLGQDLPDESPFAVEKGGQWIYSEDLGGFSGTCCYYLVLTIQSEQEIKDVMFGLGFNTPAKVWLDGKLIFSQKHHLCSMAIHTDKMNHDFTGKPQRLVIKIVSRTEQPMLQMYFFRNSELRTHAVSPYINNIKFKIVK